MAFLLGFHWGWLLGSLLLGLAAGLDRGGSSRQGRIEGAVALAGGCWPWLLVAAALARVVPGRPGYWLDLGLVMFASYLAGCALGSCLRDWVLARSAPARLRFRQAMAKAGPAEIIKTSLPHAQNDVRDSPGGMNPAKGVFQSRRWPQNIPSNMLKERVFIHTRANSTPAQNALPQGSGDKRGPPVLRLAGPLPSAGSYSRSRCWKQYAGRSRCCARSKSCTSWELRSASR